MTDVTIRNPQPVPMLDFSRQFSVLRQEILDSIEAVCSSQHFILGPQVTSFEHAAALACAAPHAIGCASGTDAIWLALAAANVGPGDAVVTTPFSFFATVSAILRCGATPLLADIDPATFNLSSPAVERLLQSSAGKNVKAVLPVHLYGQCADWDAFTALKQNHTLLLIEDAAQAFGATWNGVPAGALGDAAAFSFYPTKNLSAMGDAGLVTTTSAAIDDHARVLRAHGMRRRYYHEEIGWNSRLDSIQAAVLEVKLRYLPQWNQQRRDHALRYDKLFREASLTAESTKNGVVLPITDSRAGHVFHQYVICGSFSPTARSAARSTTLFRCTYRPASRVSATSRATSLSAKRLRWRSWLYRCTLNSVKTNSRLWSIPSPLSIAEAAPFNP
jgi:dTDP-4-amino-4,6-dideoxygalactose transaminase